MQRQLFRCYGSRRDSCDCFASEISLSLSREIGEDHGIETLKGTLLVLVLVCKKVGLLHPYHIPLQKSGIKLNRFHHN